MGILSDGSYLGVLPFLILLLSTLTNAGLLPYGDQAGDKRLNYDVTLASDVITLNKPVRFMGPGTVSELHVSSIGTLSYNKLMNSKLTSLTSNVIMTPFMAEPGVGGDVWYRQSGGDVTVDQVLADQGVDGFQSKVVVVATWANMPSNYLQGKVNTYQIVFASDVTRTYVTINYDGAITWTSSGVDKFAFAGIFASGDLLEKCGRPLSNSGTDMVWTVAETSTGSSVRGQHIFDVSNPLECYSFESPCGEPPSFSRTTYETVFSNTASNMLGWSFHILLKCKEGLELSPSVTSQKIECLYEPDYYEYAWDFEVKECIDMRATRKFTVAMDHIKPNGVDLSQLDKDELKPEILKVLTNSGVTDIVVEIEDVKKNGISSEAVEEENEYTVKYSLFSPTYANRELQAEELQGQLKTLLSSEKEIFKTDSINVEENTDKCLQQCICFFREGSGKKCKKGISLMSLRPDACCGGCNGIPYASSKKACCGGLHVYDPSISVCCDGRIKKGSHCPHKLHHS